MLRYTGHPFVDVGVATLAAFSNRRRVEDVTPADLEHAAAYLKDAYCHYKPVQNFISSIFTNSHFAQFAMSVEAREAYADEMLYAFRQDRIAEHQDAHCVFFPELAAQMDATRQHIPLLNGVGIGNFSGRGRAGIPVSGLALLAIHALPLGCYKCGHLLAFHQLTDPSDDDGSRLNLSLARKALAANRTAISMMTPGSTDGELPSYGSAFRTRYVDLILQVQQEIRDREATRNQRIKINNITGYYFTNYGPSPRLEVVRLDNAVFDFLDAAQQDAKAAWQRVVHAGWQPPKETKGAVPDGENVFTWRNAVYERLFRLHLDTEKSRFIYDLARANDWRVIELFLRKVLQMDQERIDTYRELGERLANYALRQNQPVSFYHEFSRVTKYDKLRAILRRAAEKMLREGSEEILFSYDNFIDAFEHPSDGYRQWRLGRDLIAIRMLEILHQHQLDLSELPEAQPEPEEDSEE